MRRGIVGALLASVLLIASGAGVFAQGQPEDELFGWPLEEWQQQVEERMAGSEPPRSKTLPSAMVVRKGPAASGAVALTFDDGYNAKACASIADTLRRYGAVGTFFVNGQWLTREPNRWRRILEGMEVANHTRSHPRLTQEPHPVVLNQIRTNEWIHEQVLGRPMLKALRPPYGAYGERVGRIAKSLGYDHIVMWNCRHRRLEAQRPSPSASCVQRPVQRRARSSSCIAPATPPPRPCPASCATTSGAASRSAA